MSARDRILQTISTNKPAQVPLPDIHIERNINRSALKDEFAAVLTRIGGTAIYVNSMEEIALDLNNSILAGDNVVNTIPGLSDLHTETLKLSDATALEQVYKAYVEGTVGVAENGAVWLYESKIINRLVPFICQHLVIVLRADRIVADMHEAYREIDCGREGYGVFLAGPSKTADIEQSLVIGAHGARSLVVYLIGENQ
jgi:L-lactate dehydrogenase complex protein LldG